MIYLILIYLIGMSVSSWYYKKLFKDEKPVDYSILITIATLLSWLGAFASIITDYQTKKII